jgi:hypothetical protein
MEMSAHVLMTVLSYAQHSSCFFMHCLDTDASTWILQAAVRSTMPYNDGEGSLTRMSDVGFQLQHRYRCVLDVVVLAY